MAISIEQVKKIAELARLELTSEEETKYQKQLSAILDYVGQLQELNVEQWAPEMAGLKHQNYTKKQLCLLVRLTGLFFQEQH